MNFYHRRLRHLESLKSLGLGFHNAMMAELENFQHAQDIQHAFEHAKAEQERWEEYFRSGVEAKRAQPGNDETLERGDSNVVPFTGS